MEINVWIKLAISDLSSSRLLYNAGQYRTSYFLFQQAAEKANKAFALYGGLTSEDELTDVRHDQFKVYRRSIVKQGAELKSFIAFAETLPSKVKDHKMFGYNNVLAVHEGPTEILRLIDSLKHQNLINIHATELTKMYKVLAELKNPTIKLPKSLDKKFKEIILQLADWAANFQTPEAIAAKEEYLQIASNDSKLKEFYSIMVKVLRITLDFAFIFFTLTVCGLLTIQHSSLTRYPVKEKNPLKIYTSKLPLIKKQTLFMDLLYDALIRLNHLNKKSK